MIIGAFFVTYCRDGSESLRTVGLEDESSNRFVPRSCPTLLSCSLFRAGRLLELDLGVSLSDWNAVSCLQGSAKLVLSSI